MAKIKSNSVKKILDKLKTISSNKDKYAEFFGQYGRLIKEGVYQDFEHKEALTELLRFKSTKSKDMVSLREYVERMPEDQKSIYFITGQIKFHSKIRPSSRCMKRRVLRFLYWTMKLTR